MLLIVSLPIDDCGLILVDPSVKPKRKDLVNIYQMSGCRTLFNSTCSIKVLELKKKLGKILVCKGILRHVQLVHLRVNAILKRFLDLSKMASVLSGSYE